MAKSRAAALFSNTVVFAMGNALTKLIQLVLMPLYTSFMSVDEYGIAELLNNMSELFYPLMCLCVFEATFRFAMERDINKADLLAASLCVLVAIIPIGVIAAAVAFYVFSYDFAWACLVLVVAVGFRTVLAQFARGVGKTKVFAVSGVLNTLLLLVFDMLLLVVLHWGVLGYVVALICGNIGSALYLVFSCHLWRFSSGRVEMVLLRKMLSYSLPLLPNTLAWWFMNIFGRYVLLFLQGPVAAGLYTAASKLPSMVNFLSTVFQQAWQISAAQELGEKDDISYFSKAFTLFSSFLYFGCSVLVALAMPISLILLKGEFFEGWRLVPSLMLIASIGCISAFFGTFYNAVKRTEAVFISTVLGSASNVVAAFMLVNIIGIWGVLLASVLGQFVTLTYRIIDSRKFIPISFDIKSQSVSILALVVEVVVVSTTPSILGMILATMISIAVFLFYWKRFGGYIKNRISHFNLNQIFKKKQSSF